MQRLTGETSMSKSYAGAGHPYSSNSKEAKLNTIYATTPSKRKRIFEWFFSTLYIISEYTSIHILIYKNMEELKDNK